MIKQCGNLKDTNNNNSCISCLYFCFAPPPDILFEERYKQIHEDKIIPIQNDTENYKEETGENSNEISLSETHQR